MICSFPIKLTAIIANPQIKSMDILPVILLSVTYIFKINIIPQIYRVGNPALKFRMKRNKILEICLIILVFVFRMGDAQLANDIHIQSKKFSAIQGFQAQVTVNRVPYLVPYQTAFTTKPDVGLSIYSLQFDYNPQFSISVNQQASTSSALTFYVSGQPSNSNIYNQLYIMYIASDVEQMGIYMPGPKSTIITNVDTTLQLGIPTTITNRSQEIVFNFKNLGASPIFPPDSNINNIQVSVYLTGIELQSETIQNGYSKNYAYFSLAVSKVTTNFYTILVSVHSNFGDVLMKTIQFTVLYFDISQLSSLYQINSNSVNAANFGGSFYMSSISTPLVPLPENSSYQNTLQYFFGISTIQCSQGDTINLLAVESFNYNTNGMLQNLVLTFQTQRNTYITNGIYNYIQYKPKICTDPTSSCAVPCNDPNLPSYLISSLDSLCARCLYFCTACSNGFNCTSCPSSRVINNVGICACANNTLYDDQNSLECQNCFGNNFCETCSRIGVCETCYVDYNFTFNQILRTCQCSPATYASIVKKNTTYSLALLTTICQACPPNCIYCLSADTCQACTVPTYLASSFANINGTFSTCTQICNGAQIYNSSTRKCNYYNGDTSLFDTAGRLGFDWSFVSQQNQVVINLVFSQRNISYYFFQNSQAYQFVNLPNSEVPGSGVGSSVFYYDDGNGYMGGYSSSGLESSSSSSSVINTVVQQNNGYNFDDSALRGEFYGLGQALFYKQQYQKYQPQAKYFDQFGIPFGKHKLNTTTISDAATFLDAIRYNLQFVINGQSLPYIIKAISSNQLQLIVRPQKSYLTTTASLIFKNPALVRSGETALQTAQVKKQIDRLDYYTLSQLQNAISLRDRTYSIVQILWGICKYLLFIGFGWVVMPLMLSLQYIFCHNYITTQLPLNLHYFLTAFADFRNPSILFNPQRNAFDARVVNHQQIYKSIPIYQIFDRGIDFMKNSWQFFFVPLLSFGLLFLLIFINFVLNKVCLRDIPLISKYLQKRAFLHAGAYTLVQALPISFFFFGQLQDTRYTSINSPNSIYPSFNTGIAYASFFVSAILPLILLVWIYNYYKNRARSGKFSLNKVQGRDQVNIALDEDPALIGDPLWSGNPHVPISYGFAASVFYVPLLAGFVVSFFYGTYPWQLTGLLLGNAGLASFAAASHHFQSKIPRFFFAGIGLLMVAYELIHAGVGSNRALSTYDQWNTGYLGIGIIYAIILVSMLFCGYLIYKLLTNLYHNIIKIEGCFPKVVVLVGVIKHPDEQINQRDRAFGRDEKRKTTIAHSKLSYINQPPSSDDRMMLQKQGTSHYVENGPNQYQDLEFIRKNPDGRLVFKCKQSKKVLVFPTRASHVLESNIPLIIDSENRIYTQNERKQIGTVSQLMKDNGMNQSQEELLSKTPVNKRVQSFPRQIEMINIQSNNALNDDSNFRQRDSGVQKGDTMIKIDGKFYNYDQDEAYFYLINYNGNPRYKISDGQFLDLFGKNQNKIRHEGGQFFIERSEDPGFYYLINSVNFNRAYKLLAEVLRNLLAQRNKKMIVSMLPKVSLQENNNNNQSKTNPIMLTRNIQHYQINGQTYQKVGEDANFLYFRNITTGEKLSMKRQEAQFDHIKSYQKIGSVKQLENKLQNNQQIIVDHEKYLYKGKEGQRYGFFNMSTGKLRLFSAEEVFNALGYVQPSLIIQSSIKPSLIDKMEPLLKKEQSPAKVKQPPDNLVTLKLIQTDKQKNVYIFENPQTAVLYEMPTEWIDLNANVDIDKDENIWHKGQILGVYSENQLGSSLKRSSASNRVMNSQEVNQNQRNSNNNIQSSSSLGFSKNINPDHMYNIKVLKREYNYSDDNLPSGQDIEEVRANIRGSNVPDVVEELGHSNPSRKVLIESITKPSEKFIIQ